MSEKHYPYIGGSFDRIVFDGDGSVWVPEPENAKLRELLTFYLGCLTKGHVNCDSCAFAEYLCEHGRLVIDWAREMGIEVE